MNLKALPLNELPYEKLIHNGAENLSDAELLAIIIKNGTRDLSVLDVSRLILKDREHNLLNLYELSLEELMKIDGIGRVKAIQLKAIAEISKRISSYTYIKQLSFNSPRSIAEYYMEQMRHLDKECVIAVFFDIKNQYICDDKFSTGSTSYAFFPLKEILRKAILCSCDKFAVLHNHPSGNPNPSTDDLYVTKTLKNAAALIQIHFIDHIIIGDRKYYSFFENTNEWKDFE